MEVIEKRQEAGKEGDQLIGCLLFTFWPNWVEFEAWVRQTHIGSQGGDRQ